MTATREAIGLPVLFLTVLLAGGVRLGAPDTLVPPSPYVLLLGVLLVRVVIQSGALAPDLLLSTSRSTLANLNGVIVVVTLWLAAAQTLALLMPDSGVPRLAFGVFFLLLLLNTAAASPDRRRLIRSLGVTFAGAFVIKFVVLDALAGPADTPMRRAVLAVLDTVTAGALIQPPQHPATAYLALLVVGVFLVGVFLLPHRDAASGDEVATTVITSADRPSRELSNRQPRAAAKRL
jgi:hypothetical protein